MAVCTVDPGCRGYGNKFMAEVHKDIYEMPVADKEGVTLATSLHYCIPMVSPIHVMTGQ